MSTVRRKARRVFRRYLWRVQPEPTSRPVRAPLVSILVVTYNGAPYLKPFFRSLVTTSGVDYELVVVDNASRWPARHLVIRALRKGSIDRLTLLNRNTLFVPGVNTALQLSDARARYVVLLNPDVVIRDPEWLTRMLAIHRPGATSLGCVEAKPAFADGYCLLVDRQVLVEAGGLNTDYHWWYAVPRLQADLLARGYSVQAVANHEEVLHHVGGGSGRPPMTALGMDTDPNSIRSWFGDHVVTRLPVLP